ncbi:MAG: RDD family protein [Fimbriimonadaceae bacterium]|nr:RDD family protein [Chitinophagales bacterium]
MRNIDILTSQNVTINYELAGLRYRIFAWIIDIIILSVSCGTLSFILTLVFSDLATYVNYIILTPYFLFYHLLSEIFMNGQSFGKKALGIKVVKIDGIEPSLNDYVVRWAFRAIDILLSLGAVASMLISSSVKGQRLGDIIANTTVIKTSADHKIFLTDILSIRTLVNYQPVYPQVRQFSEADMLLLKEVMDRYNQHRNEAHYNALQEAVEIVKEKLQLDKIPSDSIGFIRTLIKDYVALSR